jgi:iron(III) transport system substrate-binding protein
MKHPGISRRDLLKGTGALLAATTFSTRVLASAPPPEPVTPDLIAAAKKEGQVSYYTSTDLPVAEKLAGAFEAKYPGIAVRVERTGAERVFQRIGQEYSSNIHAVDVVNSSDTAHFIIWKRDGFSGLTFPKTSHSIRPSTATLMASSQAFGSGSASSPTTPIW